MSGIQQFDLKVPILDAMLWQYDNTERLKSLLNAKNQWYFTNYETFWAQWVPQVFNLTTANEFGLAVWSIILCVPLFIIYDPHFDKPTWGFNEVTVFPAYQNDNENFDNGNFSGEIPTVLTIEEQRLLLRIRYFQLTSRGATPDTNYMLGYLFANETKLFAELPIAYVIDGLDMTITYVFNFNISHNLIQILKDYDILPRPAGVEAKFIVVSDSIWGFNAVTVFPDYENEYVNFDNGTFAYEF